MKCFRAEIHGQLIELRYGDFGGQVVLLNGRPVSKKPLAGWTPGATHFLSLQDDAGRTRHVEVRLVQPSLGIGTIRAVILVDGSERCRLEPIDVNSPRDVCVNCGYSLQGLPIVNSEIRCPECGRHNSARASGRS